jgi:hypothetical protein
LRFFLSFEKRAQAIDPRVPEGFVTIEPFERALERAPLQPAIDDPADLVARDEPRILEDVEMLDEAGQRHPERLGQIADRLFPGAQPRERRPAGRVGQRAEDGVETVARILNHMVHCTPARAALSSARFDHFPE